MRRKVFIQASFLVSYFILISIFKHWLAWGYWPFWLGGVVGMLLPEIDHLVYVFFANPQELTSQRVRFLCRSRQLKNCFWLLYSTTAERGRLIFHTVIFQAVLAILTFWVITSSGSLFGRGLVLAFSLHLVLDELSQFLEKGDLSSWFWQLPVNLDRRQTQTFLAVVILLVFFFGFFL